MQANFQAIGEADPEPGGCIATPIGEPIEAMLQEERSEARQLDADFGRGLNGPSAVWADGMDSTDPAAIAGPEVRQVVAKAVESFNQGTKGEE